MCDDLWSEEQYAALNCIRESDGSRLLITTRLRDVVPDAKQVDLNVLSKEDAAELLCRTACLGEIIDSAQGGGARPAAIDEITRECGYLPLAVGLAGKMFGRPHADNW